MLSRSAAAVGLGVVLAACAASEQPSSVATGQLETAVATRFTYEDLAALIENQGLRRIEDVLPALPEEFRASYALVYDSRSLQGASYEDPRVILFGKDARLTCTFAGDASQVGFDTLECTQFRAATRSFDFRQVRFPSPRNRLREVAFSASGQTTDGGVRCASCHGGDSRPNWDDYDQWVGTYGFDDDALGIDAPRYEAFVARRGAHPRYRHLVQDATLATAPYTVGYAATVHRRPNVRYSDAIGRLNALRMTRLLEARLPAWQARAFAVKALGCTLSSEQSAALLATGFDPARELDLRRIFDQVGIPAREWGTSIKEAADLRKPWEHQAGFTYLSIGIGMTIASDLAAAGNPALVAGLDRIRAYFPTRYRGADLAFFTMLNETVPDPDIFGGSFERNLAEVCPELTKSFVAAALER